MKKISMIISAILLLSMVNPTKVNAEQHDMGTLRYDVNFDGSVDAKDASMVLTEYATISANRENTFTATQKWLADTDYDGIVTAKDATNILTRYAYNSTHDEPMPVVTVVFSAEYKPKNKGSCPMNYRAFFVEEIYHYINCCKDNYPDETEFLISINETIWDKPIKQSSMIVEMENQ